MSGSAHRVLVVPYGRAISAAMRRQPTTAPQIPGNGHSQEQAPGITPENLASPVDTAAELAPENMELFANSCREAGRRLRGR